MEKALFAFRPLTGNQKMFLLCALWDFAVKATYYLLPQKSLVFSVLVASSQQAFSELRVDSNVLN